MQITRTTYRPAPSVSSELPKAEPVRPEPPPFDHDRSVDSTKVYGSVGAMAGALTGRTAVTLGGAVLGGWGGYQLGEKYGLGVVGAGVGALAGLAGGLKTELVTKAGRLAGGMIGGALGSGVGLMADKFGLDTSSEMARECQGFSVGSLPKKLLDPHYSSHQKLRGKIVEDGMAQARPGDIIITNNDNSFKLELMQKATGGDAHWTHNFLVDEEGGVIDILLEDNTPRRMPLRAAFEENNHVLILRPDYESQESIKKTLDWSREQFGKITYDAKFNLDTDDAMYCQEYAYKAFKNGAPEIDIQPRKALGIKPLLTADEFIASPDMKPVWSTGSNFWVNWLSHFN